ncbi:penicillin-binding protein 2 [Salmonella enterica subsp. enterica serovar Heidelberg str. RI-11-014316]|nr:penicillin-binding protein 2 [Salmonella enterica subsp. enterica serovar Heidelberg str. RI-11-014316]
MAMSALLCGIITPQTTFFGAPTWTLPGTQRHYRDWKKPDTVCWMSLKRLRNLRIPFSIRSLI